MSHKRRKLASGSLVVGFWDSQGFFWQLGSWHSLARAAGGGVLRLQTAATPVGTPHAQRKEIWKLNGVREVMTMAMATGSEDDGGGHDSSDDVGQW